MTAEVAVMNAEALALAADSAVTLTLETGQKIFTSANKIFALSKYEPVAVMVYGNATLMGVPWETVIKRYRSRLGPRAFALVEDYAADFEHYLLTDNALSVPHFAQQHILQNIRELYVPLRDQIVRRIQGALETAREVSDDEIRKIASDAVTEYAKLLQEGLPLPENADSYTLDEFLDEYGELADLARRQIFEELPFTEDALAVLRQVARFSCLGVPLAEPSGFVIAGYGRDQLFPSLRSYGVRWLGGGLEFTEDKKVDVPTTTDAAVLAFAQGDVVYTFVEGVAREYQNAIEKDLSELLEGLPQVLLSAVTSLTDAQRTDIENTLGSARKHIVEGYRKRLAQHRREKYIKPVTDMVRWFPKEELAAAAESLVNLTSFRRRVTTSPETVGGPVDVAVISKGDGLIWIKRKHYFRPELNPQFAHNYYRDVTTQEENHGQAEEGES